MNVESDMLDGAKTALLTILATKFDFDHSYNWNAEEEISEFDGVRTDDGALVDLDAGEMPLHSTLYLSDFGPCILSPRLIVLKLTNSKIKGHLNCIEPCVNLRTLVLNDTKIKGALDSLTRLPHLRRLNLCRSKVTGSIIALASCTELQVVLLSSTRVVGNVDAFESCPDLAYCKLDYSSVFGPVEVFHKCPKLYTLDLQHTDVTGNTGILKYAAPNCNPREILALHQRLDADIH